MISNNSENYASASLSCLLSDAKEKGLLTPEEEHYYAMLAQQGDIEARNILIERNILLAAHCAKYYMKKAKSMTYDDLVQEGVLGIMRAIETYEPEKGYKFSTYATHWIKQRINRALDIQDRLIRLPIHIVADAYQIFQTMKVMDTEDKEIIAKALNMSVDKVTFIIEQYREVISMDAPPPNMKDDSDEFKMRDSIKDPNQCTEETAIRECVKEDIWRAMEKLTDKERDILIMRFGLINDRPMTLQDCGDVIGVTRERIRQLEKKALKKLKVSLRSFEKDVV